jgi:hypothetical protein
VPTYLTKFSDLALNVKKTTRDFSVGPIGRLFMICYSLNSASGLDSSGWDSFDWNGMLPGSNSATADIPRSSSGESHRDKRIEFVVSSLKQTMNISLKLKHSQSNCPISPVPRVPQLILFSAKDEKIKKERNISVGKRIAPRGPWDQGRKFRLFEVLWMAQHYSSGVLNWEKKEKRQVSTLKNVKRVVMSYFLAADTKLP